VEGAKNQFQGGDSGLQTTGIIGAIKFSGDYYFWERSPQFYL
jgi:hypothetical protein